MATLQLNHHLHSSFSRNRGFRTNNPLRVRIIPFANCQKHDDGGGESEPEPEKTKPLQGRLREGVMKIGRGLKETLSPKQKGDWNDVVLMSLSFAVYIYMSQKIVCAYCAWISML